MTYNINTNECEKVGIKFSTFLYLLSLYSNSPITESSHYDAQNRSLLTFRGKDLYGNPISPELTEYGIEVIESILKASKLPTEEEISILASTLRNLYPSGKKIGTPYNWKGSSKDIERRLKSFYLKYGTKYTEEQIINATREYVDAFKGDYRYMRLLKYFIWKSEDGELGSDLADYIDNEGQEDDTEDSWVNELR